MFKLKGTYQGYTTDTDREYVLTFILYPSFTLATTIWCTALIIYCILATGQANDGIGGIAGVYRHAIKVLVQSSALYAVFLILLVPFEVHDDRAVSYIGAMTAIARVCMYPFHSLTN